VAFDLLRLDGDDLRQRPLEKRREAVMRLVAKRRGDGILFNEALEDEGNAVSQSPKSTTTDDASTVTRVEALETICSGRSEDHPETKTICTLCHNTTARPTGACLSLTNALGSYPT
jgi:hypothetical protein